ncbi:MAG: DUF7134 domain-containing protein, partial [Solirubrobacteraceae bacterium]
MDELLALAVALAAGAAGALAGPSSAVLRVGAVVAAGGYLALAVRRRHPFAVLVVVLPTVLIAEAATPQAGAVTQFVALLVVTYSLGAYARSRALAGGLVLAAVGVALAVALGPPSRYSVGSSLAFFIAMFVLAPAGLGRLVRVRAELAERLREATDRLRESKEKRVAVALASERTRIVTKLETVVLRGLEAMREHSGAQSLRTVMALERIARDTLVQMRALLVELRSGQDVPSAERSLPELRSRVEEALSAAGVPSDAGNAARPARGRWTLVSARWLDAALTLVAITFATALAATTLSRTGLHGPRALDVLLAAAIPIPLAWARGRPLEASAAAFAIAIAYASVAAPLDPLGGPNDLAVLPALVIGAHGDRSRALAGLGLCATGVAAVLLLDPTSRPTAVDAGLFAALLLGGWALGRGVRAHGPPLGETTVAAVTLRPQLRPQAPAAVAA